MAAHVLIVEGNDGAGKTTLVNRLTARGWWTRKAKAHPRFGQWCVDMLEMSQLLGGELVAFDRFHASELVYAPIETRQATIGSDECAEVCYRLAHMNHTILWLDEEPIVCWNRSRVKDPAARTAGYDDHEWPLSRFVEIDLGYIREMGVLKHHHRLNVVRLSELNLRGGVDNLLTSIEASR